jgi:pyridoxamine 5'-phosphate oxidase
MIKFNNLNKTSPYLLFVEKYNEALAAKQQNIEAAAISTYDKNKKEVNSRYVNIKFINYDEFIFFSNYESPKANAIQSHSQIHALFYWASTNTQIRIKAKAKKTPVKFNNEYFKSRDLNKNALAISSKQSKAIDSYENVIKNFNSVKSSEDLTKCPDNWGGYIFLPYYFEFWEGDDFRLNKRVVFDKCNNEWKKTILQP